MAKREVLRTKICTGPDRNRKENLQNVKRVNPGRQKDGADDRELRKALPLDKERELSEKDNTIQNALQKRKLTLPEIAEMLEVPLERVPAIEEEMSGI